MYWKGEGAEGRSTNVRYKKQKQLVNSLRQYKCLHTQLNDQGFAGGPVVKNSPVNAGDTDLIPGPQRSHMP